MVKFKEKQQVADTRGNVYTIKIAAQIGPEGRPIYFCAATTPAAYVVKPRWIEEKELQPFTPVDPDAELDKRLAAALNGEKKK